MVAPCPLRNSGAAGSTIYPDSPNGFQSTDDAPAAFPARRGSHDDLVKDWKERAVFYCLLDSSATLQWFVSISGAGATIRPAELPMGFDSVPGIPARARAMFDHHMLVSPSSKTILQYISLVVSPSSFVKEYVLVYTPIVLGLLLLLLLFVSYAVFCYFNESLPAWCYGVIGVIAQLIPALFIPAMATLMRSFSCSFLEGTYLMTEFSDLQRSCFEMPYLPVLIISGVAIVCIVIFSTLLPFFLPARLFHWQALKSGDGRVEALAVLARALLVCLRILTFCNHGGFGRLSHPIVGSVVTAFIALVALRYLPFLKPIYLWLFVVVHVAMCGSYIGFIFVEIFPYMSKHPHHALNDIRWLFPFSGLLIGAVVGVILLLMRLGYLWARVLRRLLPRTQQAQQQQEPTKTPKSMLLFSTANDVAYAAHCLYRSAMRAVRLGRRRVVPVLVVDAERDSSENAVVVEEEEEEDNIESSSQVTVDDGEDAAPVVVGAMSSLTPRSFKWTPAERAAHTSAIRAVEDFYTAQIEQNHPGSIKLRLLKILHLLELGAEKTRIKLCVNWLNSSEILVGKSTIALDDLYLLYYIRQRTNELDLLPAGVDISATATDRRSRKLVRSELRRIASLEKESSELLGDLWAIYLSDEVSAVSVAAIVSKLIFKEESVRELYKRVLDRHASSGRVMEKFAAFLRRIGDPVLAAVYERKALGEGVSRYRRESSAVEVDLEASVARIPTVEVLRHQGSLTPRSSLASVVSATSHASSFAFANAMAPRLAKFRSPWFICLRILLFVSCVCSLVGLIVSGVMQLRLSSVVKGDVTSGVAVRGLSMNVAELNRLLLNAQLNFSTVEHAYADKHHLGQTLVAQCQALEKGFKATYYGVTRARMLSGWRLPCAVPTFNRSHTLVSAVKTITRYCVDIQHLTHHEPAMVRMMPISRFVRNSWHSVVVGLRQLALLVETDAEALSRTTLIVTSVMMAIPLVFFVLAVVASGLTWAVVKRSFRFLLQVPKPIVMDTFKRTSGDGAVDDDAGPSGRLKTYGKCSTTCHFLLGLLLFVSVVLLFGGGFMLLSFAASGSAMRNLATERSMRGALADAHVLRGWMADSYHFGQVDKARDKILELKERIETDLATLTHGGSNVLAVDHDSVLSEAFYQRHCESQAAVKKANGTLASLYCPSLSDLYSDLLDNIDTFVANKSPTAVAAAYTRIAMIVDDPPEDADVPACSAASQGATTTESHDDHRRAIQEGGHTHGSAKGCATGPLEARIAEFEASVNRLVDTSRSLLDALSVFLLAVAILWSVAAYLLVLRKCPVRMEQEYSRTRRLLLQLPGSYLRSSGLLSCALESSSILDVLGQKISMSKKNTSEELMSVIDQFSVLHFDRRRRIIYANRAAETDVRHELKIEELLGDSFLSWLRSSTSPTFSSYLVLDVADVGKHPVYIHIVRMPDLTHVAFVQSTDEQEKQKELLQYEKEKSDELLLNVLPKKIAATMKEHGEVPFSVHEHCSILFADLVEFTERSSKMQPETIIGLLDQFFKGLDRLCVESGLEKLKTIGDCYFAVAGVPEFTHDHAKKAFLFAIEIFRFMFQFNLQNAVDYDLRIGINTGKAIAGVVGAIKWSFDIWGDDVNIASRMESTAENGTIQISRKTYVHLYKEFEFAEREVPIKGKGLMKCYTYRVEDPFREVAVVGARSEEDEEDEEEEEEEGEVDRNVSQAVIEEGVSVEARVDEEIK